MATNIPKTTSDTIKDLRKTRATQPRSSKASKPPAGTQTANPKANPSTTPTGAQNAVSDVSGAIRGAADAVRSGILTEAPNFSQWKVTDFQTDSSSLGETDLKAGQAILDKIERKRMTAQIVKANQGLQTDLNTGASEAGKLLSTAASAAASLEAVNTGLEKYRQNLEKTQLEGFKADAIKLEGDGARTLLDGVRALQAAKHQKLMSQVQAVEAQAARYLSAPVAQTVDVSHTDM